jgi:hypothetical protein
MRQSSASHYTSRHMGNLHLPGTKCLTALALNTCAVGAIYSPHFTDGEREAQKAAVNSASHTDSKWLSTCFSRQHWDSKGKEHGLRAQLYLCVPAFLSVKWIENNCYGFMQITWPKAGCTELADTNQHLPFISCNFRQDCSLSGLLVPLPIVHLDNYSSVL